MEITYNLVVLFAYLAFMLISSLIALILFIVDKKKAKNGERRIQEKTLLEVAILNGALGALIGRLVAHHKTNKIYFSIVIYFSLIVQLLVGILLVVLCF
jgi:uncharacterized membrane protein YsdA (DUF1294 family)